MNSLDERKSRDFSEVLADTDISFDSTWSEIDEIVTTNRVFHKMERWKFAVRTQKYYLEIVLSTLFNLSHVGYLFDFIWLYYLIRRI